MNEITDISKIYRNPNTSYDEYDQSNLCIYLNRPLSNFQQNFILSAFQQGTKILSAKYAREEWLPCPIIVNLQLPSNENLTVFLRINRHINGVKNEARILPILCNLGLPVPKLIAGPVIDPGQIGLGEMTLLSQVPGTSIQDTFWNASIDELKVVNEQIIDAVLCLHKLTEPIIKTGADKFLKRNTLSLELQNIIKRKSDWSNVPEFEEAIEKLQYVVANIQEPLVFSNGDYNPGNFLCENGNITGFIDFSMACFEDPLIGFAKFIIYDMAPFNKAGIVENYLNRMGRDFSEFAPRLAIKCLWTLQREITVDGVEDMDYRTTVLELLHKSLTYL